MEYSLPSPEIHDKQWLPHLGMAVAVHVFLLLAGFYAPQLFNFNREVLEIRTVQLVDVAELPRAEQPDQPPAARPASTSPVRKTPKISKPAAPATSQAPLKPATTVTPMETNISVGAAVADMALETDPNRANTGIVLPIKTTATESAPAGSHGKVDRESGRKRYLGQLMAHIESYKFYPPNARRRRIEGEVRVQFTITGEGKIENLLISDADPALIRAAREAVARALPLPPPEKQIDTPLSVSYRMEFRLR